MAEEEKQGISKYLDEIGLGILAGLIKGLIYDDQGRNRFSLLAELIGQNTTAINKRALKATESDATDANSYVKKADKATNADTVDNKHASDFATSAQGTKADSAVQTIQINGTAQTKTNGVVNLPAYPTVPTKVSAFTNDSGYITSSSIPTVNNGTLTIKAGGTSKGTFTANQSGNTEVNITASDLGLSSALKYVGAVSTLPTPTTTDNYNNGDVVSVGSKEYLRTGKTSSSAGSWKELGDESSHALKTVTITGTGALSGGGTLEANRTITHNNSGVTAGTYRSVTVNAYGHVTAGTNPTTIAGYGITDAKIANGVITLGNNTITPLTSHQDISGLVKTSDLTASTAIANSHVALADKLNIETVRLTNTDDLNNCIPESATPNGWSDHFFKVYEWHMNSKPLNIPCEGICWMEVSAVPDITNGQQRWNIYQKVYKSNAAGDTTHIYIRTGWKNTALFWSKWVELTQESRALTEDEITNIWNNIFN